MKRRRIEEKSRYVVISIKLLYRSRSANTFKINHNGTWITENVEYENRHKMDIPIEKMKSLTVIYIYASEFK